MARKAIYTRSYKATVQKVRQQALSKMRGLKKVAPGSKVAKNRAAKIRYIKSARFTRLVQKQRATNLRQTNFKYLGKLPAKIYDRSITNQLPDARKPQLDTLKRGLRSIYSEFDLSKKLIRKDARPYFVAINKGMDPTKAYEKYILKPSQRRDIRNLLRKHNISKDKLITGISDINKIIAGDMNEEYLAMLELNIPRETLTKYNKTRSQILDYYPNLDDAKKNNYRKLIKVYGKDWKKEISEFKKVDSNWNTVTDEVEKIRIRNFGIDI